MMNPINRAIDGAALAPLNNEQKRDLVLLARRAYKRYVAKNSAPLSFDDWRHNEQRMAIESRSLTTATQEDFAFLKSHYLSMCGEEVRADRMRARAAMEPRRVAMHKLDQECAAAEDVIQNAKGYVAAIARCRFKTSDLTQLSEKQIWGLVFDIRRNAQRRRRIAKVVSGSLTLNLEPMNSER